MHAADAPNIGSNVPGTSGQHSMGRPEEIIRPMLAPSSQMCHGISAEFVWHKRKAFSKIFTNILPTFQPILTFCALHSSIMCHRSVYWWRHFWVSETD